MITSVPVVSEINIYILKALAHYTNYALYHLPTAICLTHRAVEEKKSYNNTIE